ncbi:MAG: alpha/beta fold hydrolase [bacterium]
MPALPELRFAKADSGKLEGNRLSYIESGVAVKGNVVLLHGIGSNATGWRHLIPRLSAEYRVIAWNAPGYYLSDNICAESPSHVDYADALAALLDALHIQDVFVVGSSFGSLVAASFAVCHPERLKALVLLGATRGHKHLAANERSRLFGARAAAIQAGPLEFAANRFRQLVAADASAEVISEVRQILAAVCTRGFLQAARTVSNTDVVEFARKIGVPTLLAVGTEDKVNPIEVSRVIHGGIPRSKLAMLDRVGHMSKIEAPERVLQLVEQHFAEV